MDTSHKTIVAFIAGCLIGGAVTTFFVADRGPGHGGMRHQGEYQKERGMGMGAMMDHGMHSMQVASEREFITMMIPHHEEAITTATEVLARGGTTEAMRTLAENIIAAQTKEVADMKTWYEAWYGEPYTPAGDYAPMMRPLGALTGSELDRAFLEDMIMHHRGAIMMAMSVEPHIEHEEVRTLAANIIKTQAEEITLMETLLRGE